MDGIGGTVKNMVYRCVLAGDIVINNPKQFASYADDICNVDSLYLPNEQLLKEPEEIQHVEPIPETLKTHKVVRGMSKHNVPFNSFYYLSSDEKPHFTQWYGKECGHLESNVDDNTCCYCRRKYRINEEWMECPICKKWFHEQCFYV